MTNYLRLLVLVGVILVGTESQSLAITRKFIGYADESCGKWTQERSNQYSFLKFGMEVWALGFVSGANWTTTGKDPLDGIDAAAVHGWIDNYCKQNPLQKFVRAVMDLAQELSDRADRTR
jgi:hypothetical protein